jgi:hypothetical protein
MLDLIRPPASLDFPVRVLAGATIAHPIGIWSNYGRPIPADPPGDAPGPECPVCLEIRERHGGFGPSHDGSLPLGLDRFRRGAGALQL